MEIRLVIINHGNQPQTDPRFDKKYNSIDWQDEVEEMDKILEQKKQNNNDNDEAASDQDHSSNDNGNDEGSSDGDN